jgi:hypothetical protein
VNLGERLATLFQVLLARVDIGLHRERGVVMPRPLADDGDGDAGQGAMVRIALGDPDSPVIARRGNEEGIGDAVPAKVRNAITLYRPLLASDNVEIRLHQTVLYDSIYRADDQLFVNQHVYGIPAAHAPVFCLRKSEKGDMVTAYLDSFERVWTAAYSIR